MRITIDKDAEYRIKLFTHTDLDGVGCAILAKAMFGNTVDIELIEANCSSETIKNWIDNDDCKEFDALFITDLSVSDEVADLIEKIGFKQKALCDHHKTASNLNSRDWCTVVDEESNCGTTLFYKYLYRTYRTQGPLFNILRRYTKFADAVHQYDNWVWIKNDRSEANDLNTLLKIIGKKRFIERFVVDPDLEFSTDELAILQLENERKERYIYKHKLTSFLVGIDVPGSPRTYSIALVYADEYENDLARELFRMYPTVDIAGIIKLPFTISFRLKDFENTELDASKVASAMGGGGHIGSAGAPITSEDKLKLASILFANHNVKVVTNR